MRYHARPTNRAEPFVPLLLRSYNESETIAKYEIMDGAPVRGESIPVRAAGPSAAGVPRLQLAVVLSGGLVLRPKRRLFCLDCRCGYF